jgi:hypothetical protein
MRRGEGKSKAWDAVFNSCPKTLLGADSVQRFIGATPVLKRVRVERWRTDPVPENERRLWEELERETGFDPRA